MYSEILKDLSVSLTPFFRHGHRHPDRKGTGAVGGHREAGDREVRPRREAEETRL